MSRVVIPYKGKTWLIMQCLKDFGAQYVEQLTQQGHDEDAVSSIRTLQRMGHVKRMDDGSICLTLTGLRTLRAINDEANPGAGVAGKREIAGGSNTETYKGEGMGRTCGREGAYDAYELPSLIMGERHYPREIKP